MSGDALAFARAAEALEGTPFRLYGRSIAHGLDCAGVVVAALARMGRQAAPLPRYALRNMEFAPFEKAIRASGFIASPHAQAPGDLLVLTPSPGQFHLAIAIDDARIVHAHAGLRRVVITTSPKVDHISRRYRLT